MTKRKDTRSFDVNSADVVVARRKNGRARYQNTVTARMSGWLPDTRGENLRATMESLSKASLQGMVNGRFSFNSKTTKAELIDGLMGLIKR